MEKAWPETPRKLLEERYKAFVSGNVDYILESHHPDTRAQLDRSAIESWATESRWLGLDIEEEKPVDKERTFLTFTVRYEKDFKTFNHREFAEFRKSEGKWFYFDSEFPKPETIRREGDKVGRNDSCPCGSQKKFKKCCGASV